MAPLANYFIASFNVSMALILQGVIFTVILFVCCLLVKDPTKGDKELQAKLQAEADEEEAAAIQKAEAKQPTMGWKKAFTHPALWMVFFSIILIQLIGNVLITDISVIGESTYGVSETQSAWVVSAFNIGAGIGGIVIGFISDKIGPYLTTFYLGIIDGILLAILAFAGAGSFTLFAVICVIQGFTYNGITTLNPIMMSDSYDARDLGTVMAFTGIAVIIVGVLGPQFGIMLPFAPMLQICAVSSIIGGILAALAAKSLRKYYKSIGSGCVIR